MFATVTLKTPLAKTPEFQARARAVPTSPRAEAHLASLTADEQKTCPVTNLKLGSMGDPIPVEIGGRKVWTCCDACTPKLKANPAKYLAKLGSSAADAVKALTAQEQQICPVTGAKLGSMGEPVLADVEGRKTWTCCAACPPKLKAEPAKYLARLQPAPENEVLSVPESAVIDTGSRKVVYVESEPGVFEGRAVVLGPRIGDRFPVLEGLAPGQKVAASGAFLIDAESRINPGAVPTTPGEGTPPKANGDEPTTPKSAGALPRSAAANSTEGAHRH
jgi:hypothetical protein